MPAADATPFPIKNQAFRFTVCIRNYTTGNPITGGLSGLSGTASGDGAAFAVTGITVAEIGTTGFVTVDVAAAQMNVSAIVVNVSATNTNAVNAIVEIPTLNIAEGLAHWQGQTVKRLEQGIVQAAAFLLNQNVRSGTTQVMYTATGTAWLDADVTSSDTGATKGKMDL